MCRLTPLHCLFLLSVLCTQVQAAAIVDFIAMTAQDNYADLSPHAVAQLESGVQDVTRPFTADVDNFTPSNVCEKLADMCWREAAHDRSEKNPTHPINVSTQPENFIQAPQDIYQFTLLEEQAAASEEEAQAEEAYQAYLRQQRENAFLQDYLDFNVMNAIKEFVRETETGRTVEQTIRRNAIAKSCKGGKCGNGAGGSGGTGGSDKEDGAHKIQYYISVIFGVTQAVFGFIFAPMTLGVVFAILVTLFFLQRQQYKRKKRMERRRRRQRTYHPEDFEAV